jgi:hypothetical protein
LTIFRLLEGSEYAQLIIPLALLIIVMLVLFIFLQTRFGLILRATGDNDQMVRAIGGNTNFTILIGMGLSNALVAMAGAMIAQYQSFTDISMGVGMVVIGLASVIIGEVIFGIKSLFRRLLAVVHSGREGTFEGIVPRALGLLSERGGHPARMLAWIAPSVCPDHYEVSAELAAQFRARFGENGAVRGRRLNLPEIVRAQLLAGGLLPQHIETDTRATCEDADLFYSYRREGAQAGRMFTFAMMR